MSSEEDRNGKDIDELEMFESLDDSDVVLDTYTIEKKMKISDFYNVNPTISYILFAVLGRIGIFFLAIWVRKPEKSRYGHGLDRLSR